MERDVARLKSEVDAKTREVELLKKQQEEDLKNQQERLKLDLENANQKV